MLLVISFIISDAQLDARMIRWDLKTYQGHSGHSRAILCRLGQTIVYTQRVTSLVDLLTVGDHPHILDKTMDNCKGLCKGQFRLLLSESI